MDWQPIETAPRLPPDAPLGADGPYILVCNEFGTWVAAHCPRYISGFKPQNPWQCMMLNVRHLAKMKNGKRAPLVPTHWMPLPEPPTDKPHPA